MVKSEKTTMNDNNAKKKKVLQAFFHEDITAWIGIIHETLKDPKSFEKILTLTLLFYFEKIPK